MCHVFTQKRLMKSLLKLSMTLMLLVHGTHFELQVSLDHFDVTSSSPIWFLSLYIYISLLRIFENIYIYSKTDQEDKGSQIQHNSIIPITYRTAILLAIINTQRLRAVHTQQVVANSLPAIGTADSSAHQATFCWEFYYIPELGIPLSREIHHTPPQPRPACLVLSWAPQLGLVLSHFRQEHNIPSLVSVRKINLK